VTRAVPGDARAAPSARGPVWDDRPVREASDGVEMDDEQAVVATVLDYVEGWFNGEAERMDRALHPELVKRCVGLEGDDPDALETLTATEMVDATADGVGRAEDADDRQIDIQVTYLHGDIATATCLCHRYVDLVQLVRMPEGWRIVNAVWELR
jgi:Putative lumazine-binding